MQEPVRIGILGTGRIVRRWLRDVPPQARIVAIASREETRAVEAAHAYGIDSYCASYEALYARADVDAVYVAMPNQGHMENAMAAMRAGKHVLCEKPAGVNAAQWERMTECARKNGVLLMEAMWTRCFPAMRRLLAVLAEGKIGTL
ncbi:MAG: Gfo/Idh/MocA family oxidoreductase, partial [Clostridia bacterium]